MINLDFGHIDMKYKIVNIVFIRYIIMPSYYYYTGATNKLLWSLLYCHQSKKDKNDCYLYNRLGA